MNLRLLLPTVGALLAQLLCLQIVVTVQAQGQASDTTTGTGATSSSSSSTLLKTFQIYHSLGANEKFLPRGTIEFTGEDVGDITATMKHDENCLASSSIASDLQALVASNGFYRVKVVDDESGKSVLASASACDFRRSNFREEIDLSLGDTGSLISVSYKPIVSPLAKACVDLPPLDMDKEKEYQFRTKVTYSTASHGMTIPVVMPQNRPPPGYAWIKRLVKRGENTATAGSGSGGGGTDNNSPPPFDPEQEAKKTENQSFFRRYWYIILPVTIMTFLGSEEPEPNNPNAPRTTQQGGGGGAQASVGMAGAASAAAVGGAASRGQARQRRGKRG